MKTHVVIPVYNMILLPEIDYQIGIESLSKEERERIEKDGNRAILLPLREQISRADRDLGKFFDTGVLVDILEIRESNRGTRLHAKTGSKARVENLRFVGEALEAEFVVRPEISDITEKGERDFLDSLKKITIELAGHIQGGQLAINYVQSCNSLNEYGAMFCQFYDMTPEEKFALLDTDSLRERGLLMQEALLRFKGDIDLQIDLNKRYNDTEGNAYKKAAIQKQIGLLQQELDEMDPDYEAEENDYKKKIDESGMPDHVRKEVERILRRYMEAQQHDPEKSSLENYLDFVTSLQWSMQEEDRPVDLKKARRILNRDHFGLDKVKERILQQLSVMTLKKKQTGSILLFVGPPGTGKTSMGKGIAEALGREYVRISLGGIRDEAEIRGHRRTYVGAMAGRIMDGIRRSGVMNPVVVLDEIDKLSQGYQGDPASALLEVLDPEQNSTFTDHYLNVPYDLSHVFFICTANGADTIPRPLLDRMEVIQLTGYSPIEKLQIAKKHLLPKAMEDAGITREDLKVTDSALRRVISEYTMEAGVRGLKKQMDKLCRHRAAELVENGPGLVTVRDKDIPSFLGNKSILHDHILKTNQVGVATGLAWTQVGGEILFIETTAMAGSGQIVLTGQLGDVMKESARISVSLVKSMFIEENLDFKDKDIHIHVPSGAVPKDGPSAGVTLFTALVSLVTGRPVRREVAMTGEISLRGQVLPIGGLPEKLLAAQRAGAKKVLIPRDNLRDLEDVAEEVREALEILPMDTVHDVVREAIGMELPARVEPLIFRLPSQIEKKSAKA